MSADEVVASVKDVITRIESVALCDEQEDTKHSIEDSIKLLVAKTQGKPFVASVLSMCAAKKIIIKN